MKKVELRQIIKEEIQKVLNVNSFKLSNFLRENEDNDLPPAVKQALRDGGYVKIESGTDVQVGKRVLGYNGYFGKIVSIKDGNYKIEDDAYGDKTSVNRKKLEAQFLIEK
jgi:hypothetical protein